MNVDRRTALGALAGAVGAALASPLEATGLDGSGTDSADAVGLLFDSTRCAGCRACVRACRDAAGLRQDDRTAGYELYDAPTDLNDRTRTIIKLAPHSERPAFVKQQCMHCLDPACVAACMLGALHKGPGGAVVWDPAFCVGCRYCQVACPFNVPKFEWASPIPKIVKCDLCASRISEGGRPACVEACPREAVVFGRRDDLIAEGHHRIAANPGRYERRVYGEEEIGGTQVLMLAGVPFENLGLPRTGSHPTHDFQRTLQHAIYRGFVGPAALYAVLGFVMVRNRGRFGGEEGEEAEDSGSAPTGATPGDAL